MNDLQLVNTSSEMTDVDTYDVFFAALGFEARAVAVASSLGGKAAHRFAFGFDHNQVLSYKTNLDWFSAANFIIHKEMDSASFEEEVLQIFSKQDDCKLLKLAIDVSCFDRHRLAIIISALWKTAIYRELQIDFHYCIAAFRAPSSINGRNEVAGPIHRSFAGRFVDPARPIALVAGLGYEPGKVVGAAEYLQASRVIALFPESPVLEYEREVKKANKLLLNELPAHDILRYSVTDCRKTIATLDSIIRGLQGNYNTVLLPGGPKMFVLASLLVQRIHPQTSIWRVSSGAAIAPTDVESSGNFVSARLMVGPTFFS